MRFNIISTILLLCSLSYATVTKTIYGNLKVTGTVDSTGRVTAASMPALTGDVTTSAGAIATTAAATQANIATLSRAAGVGVHGTNTNDSAAAGYVGEVVECNLALGSIVTLTDDDYTNVCSMALTAGDWLVSGQVVVFNNSATTPAECYGVVLNAANGNMTGDISGKTSYIDDCSGVTGNKYHTISIKPYRFSTSGSATMYVKARFNSASVATTQAYGSGIAWRIR